MSAGLKLEVAMRAGGRKAWRAAPKYVIVSPPPCAKCGHAYGEHTRIRACGACLCDRYEAKP